MIQEFFARVNNNLYGQTLFVLGALVMFSFFFLPKEKKRKPELFCLFLFVVLVYFYENLATYMVVDKKANEVIHNMITDTPFQGWNIWVLNLFNYQISKALLLVYILQLIYSPGRKKILKGILFFHVSFCLILQVSGWYPLYNFQPPIYFLGNTILILGSGLYFIDLVTEDQHLEKQLLRNWPFWIVTLILFQSAISFLSDLAYEYLAFNNEALYTNFVYISMILYMTLFLVIGLYFLDESRIFHSKKTKHPAHAA